MDRDDLEASKRNDDIHRDSEAPNNNGHPTTHGRGLPPASQNPPNLSLNIDIVHLSPWVLYVAVTVDSILQGGVVVLAGLDAWAVGWDLAASNSANKGAPILFVIGTIIMCCGLITCASLIGKSTEEISCEHQKGLNSRLIWLQLRQVIGDQSFDPFAFFETTKKPVKVWICSARKTEESYMLEPLSARDKENSQIRKSSPQQGNQNLGLKKPMTVSDRDESSVVKQREPSPPRRTAAWRILKPPRCYLLLLLSSDMFYNPLVYEK